MRQALNKLVSAHPQHNLEVDPVPPSAADVPLPSSRKTSGSGSRTSEGQTPPKTAAIAHSRTHSFDPMSPLDLEDLTV